MTTELDDLNPRAAIGGNDPPAWALIRLLAEDQDVAQTVTDFLQSEHAQWPLEVAKLLEEARTLPHPITSKEERDLYPGVIKRIRDLKAKLEGLHVANKEPFLRGGQAQDQFWFGLIDKLSRRSKTNRAGAGDVLLARLTDHDAAVLAAENARRAAEAAEAKRVAEAARKKAEEERLAAEEAERAAARARKPETVEAKTEVAAAATAAAIAAQEEAKRASSQATEAYLQTLAKPAAIMRNRGDDGTLTTMAQETYAEIVDRTKLDLAKLAPYLSLEALQKALNAWAKSTDYRQPMEGAEIGRRPKTVVR